MFDLIDECGKELKSYGYRVKSVGNYGISVASLNVSDEKQSKELGLSEGKYFIITSPFLHQFGKDNEDVVSDLIADKLKNLLKHLNISTKDRLLLACLGNFDIEGDRLGKEVFDRVDIANMAGDNLYKICPNIFLFTGIETANIIKMLASNLKIKCVIIIDSLTTTTLSRLGVSFQLSSSGMTPGSGVNRFGKAIDAKLINASCISIGVPFMINSLSLCDECETILVPKDISVQIACAGRVIANAIMKVVK